MRRQTILMVARAIVAVQSGFFIDGVTSLKPLTLKDIAQALQINLSTVQRATKGKYAQTPQGVFELSYFFSSGVEDGSGIGVSAKAIKEHIRQMIAAEDPTRPLSDGALAAKLANQGIRIARRTVAKYRDTLNVLPAAQRKHGYRVAACA